MNPRTPGYVLACVLFLASGTAALAYQVIWQRILGIFSGQHIYSVTMIVTAFMAGLGFGSLFGGKIADGWSRRQAIAAFGVCELGIGLFALISPWLYYDVAYHHLGFLVRYPFVLPVVHLALLIGPTLLMGASLPLLARGLVPSTSGAAKVIGGLYGFNTLGAALGAFATVWLLVPEFGFVGTIRLVALLNFAAAAGALVLMRGAGSAVSDRGADPANDVTITLTMPDGLTAAEFAEDSPKTDGRGLLSWAGIYALSGFLALSLEILWFRILDAGIKSSPYTFGHLLGFFLLFLGLGSVIGGRIASRVANPVRFFFVGQWGITISSILSLALLTRWPAERWPLAGLTAYWTTDSGLALKSWAEAGSLMTQVWLLLPLSLIALPTLLMGLTYAFIQRAVQTDPANVGWRVGVIQTANIAGSILGGLLTGTLLLDFLGTPTTLRLLALVGAAFPLIWLAGEKRLTAIAALAIAAFTLTLALLIPAPDAFWARLHGTSTSDLIVAEDASSVVGLQRLSRNQAVMRVGGTGHSVLPYGGAHTILGSLSVLLHPAPTDALIIGLGAGNTAWAAGVRPSLERIDVYEIARPEHVVMRRLLEDESEWFGSPSATQLFADPRLQLHFADGRLALRNSDRRYDVVEADALEPHMAYSGNLYSLEFYQSGARVLKPGGFLCSYVPTARTERTMVQAFPHVLRFQLGDLTFMVGSAEPVPFDRETVLSRLAEPGAQVYLRRSHMERAVVAELEHYLERAVVTRIGPDDREAFLGGGDINTDLFPRDEYTRHRSGN